MSRAARPNGFGARMQALRRALGRKGEETSMRGFARELGMSPQGYRYWENPGSYPGHSKLANALANVAAIKERKLDPARLAVWLETGEGPEPWLAKATTAVLSPSTPSAVDLKNPLAASGDIDHRTPWRVLITLADLAKHDKNAELKALLGSLRPVA
ncbi:MAG TPA: hypothetical protein VFF73_10000, partial [Planctomycetota bacterium]|nr:hypothetical protein [Planctomycetota bacterium]